MASHSEGKYNYSHQHSDMIFHSPKVTGTSPLGLSGNTESKTPPVIRRKVPLSAYTTVSADVYCRTCTVGECSCLLDGLRSETGK